MEINVIWVLVAAFLGGMATALIGWSQQGGPWNSKKFIGSLAGSMLGAVIAAFAIEYETATVPLIYLNAFLIGAGVEVGANRIIGAIAAIKRRSA